ncbi:hypothetical protein HAX54_000255, partial [Datura stramonium]|nr:hypothetical protein [Datura stramonium]
VGSGKNLAPGHCLDSDLHWFFLCCDRRLTDELLMESSMTNVLPITDGSWITFCSSPEF